MINEPSILKKKNINALYHFWFTRQQKGQNPLKFRRIQSTRTVERQVRMRKRKAYVETSNVDDSMDKRDNEDQDEDDKELDTPEAINPIKISSDEFLQSLTSDPTFKACLDLYKQAKVLVFTFTKLV
jgi:hypothetical protein